MTLVYLISLLYVMPTYFRRLAKLITHLQTNHPGVYSQLGNPSLSMLDSNIRSTTRLVMFVLRKDYCHLGDGTATDLANAARWRMLYSMLGALIPVGFALMQMIG